MAEKTTDEILRKREHSSPKKESEQRDIAPGVNKFILLQNDYRNETPGATDYILYDFIFCLIIS